MSGSALESTKRTTALRTLATCQQQIMNFFGFLSVNAHWFKCTYIYISHASYISLC